ncbi:Crp/Fnr family transcriptional regulator [Kitasatospora sp. NPDC092948]|uniref:Crp/Fnr family transcriptional regulator n=1 Tax=Kitasatospora sp. NPDC092948 TaxID=3364088 RepID=UPI003827B058
MIYGSHMNGRALFLDTLTEGTRTALERLGTRKHFAAGEMLIKEGDKSRDLILLHSGLVKVTNYLGRRTASLMDIKIAGDVVGEIAAVDSGPRSATVTACRMVTTTLIPWHNLLPFLHASPEASMALHQVLGRSLRSSNLRRLEFGTYTAPVRLARVLVELANSYGKPCRKATRIDVNLTQTEYADLVGCRTRTAHQALRGFRRAKLISTEGQQTYVHDMPGLQRAARLRMPAG